MNSHQVASFVLLIWHPADVTAAEHWGSLMGERERKKKKKKAKSSPGEYASAQRLSRIGSILRNLHITATCMEANGRQFSQTPIC